MRFLNHPMLWWGVLVVVPIVLYLFRHKPKTQRVSTLMFFKSLAREHQESAWMRKLKRLISLLLTLLVIAAATAALARLVQSPPADAMKSIVILVDRSASMSARVRDSSDLNQSRSRLEVAIDRVRQRLAGLPGGISVSVMTYDKRPEILVPRSLDRREVERSLASIQMRPIDGEPDKALDMAVRLAALETPAAVWHLSDSSAETITEKDVRVEHLNVALAEPVNVGITAFQMRRRPMDASMYEVFVQANASGPKPIETELRVLVDGKEVGLRFFKIKPGQQWSSSAQGSDPILIKAGDGERLTLKLNIRDASLKDVLAIDDEVHVRVPELKPLRVVWISEESDGFTELALSSLIKGNEIEVIHGKPGSWPPNKEDKPPNVVIFQGWLPKVWPGDVPVIVLDAPASAQGVIRAVRIGDEGLPVDSVRSPDDRHPLLYGVASARVRLTQTAVLEAGGSLEPLWIGPTGPIMVAGEVEGQRVTAMAFAPAVSESLPLMASYPLLIGNAIYWSVDPQLEAMKGNNLATGDLVSLEGKKLTWMRGKNLETVELKGSLAELDRVGLWKTDTGETGSASLLSLNETKLVAAPKGDAVDEVMSASWFGGDLTNVLVVIVLVTLVVESWLFHRHSVY